MRLALISVLIAAGVSAAQAQSLNQERIEKIAPKNPSTGRMAVLSRGLPHDAAQALQGGDPPATAPDRDVIEFANQLLPEPFRMADVQLETVEWRDLGGWAQDDHAAAFEAFLKSCKGMIAGGPPRLVGATFSTALQSTCRRAIKTPPRNAASARIFFERNFRPMRIARLGEENGFLTGYYEPVIEGSRIATEEFNVPLYRKPHDAGGGTYFDRAAIEDGALKGRKLEICWLKDPTDLFFAQIQGSARVRLEDGKILRLNYSGSNGWKYTPIGRILIDREIVPKEEMSMDRIREWIEANPKEGKALRRQNKSYVFFRETSLSDFEEPIGAQGISLTPLRSIATDKTIHVYGTPFYIEAELPLDNERSENTFQRLMIAQDTGGAIKGPARADLYFGSVGGSASVAGRIRHVGQFTMFIPREIDPVIAGRNTPLPRPRPVFDWDEKPEAAADADQKVGDAR